MPTTNPLTWAQLDLVIVEHYQEDHTRDGNCQGCNQIEVLKNHIRKQKKGMK